MTEVTEPGFRKLTIPGSYPSQSQANPSSSKTSKARLSLPPHAYTYIINHLISDACQATHKDQKCKTRCFFREQPFSRELKNLSMANKKMRSAVWRKKLEILVIKYEESFSKLGCIKVEDRKMIRAIIVEGTADIKRVSQAWFETSRPQFCSKVNRFIATCPSLERLVDTSAIDAPTTRPTRESLTHPRVRELHIAFPSYGYHHHPFQTLYPSLTHLVLVETESHLFGDHTKCEIWSILKPQEYLDHIFGTYSHQITELTIKAKMPDEERVGDWSEMGEKMLFGEICSHLRELKKLNLIFEAPFTRTRRDACMIPFIFGALAKHPLPIQQVNITSDGVNWDRIEKALANSGDPDDLMNMIREDDWQPDHLAPLFKNLRAEIEDYRKRCATFRFFTFKHMEVIEDLDEAKDKRGKGKVKDKSNLGMPLKRVTLKHYSAEMVPTGKASYKLSEKTGFDKKAQTALGSKLSMMRAMSMMMSVMFNTPAAKMPTGLVRLSERDPIFDEYNIFSAKRVKQEGSGDGKLKGGSKKQAPAAKITPISDSDTGSDHDLDLDFSDLEDDPEVRREINKMKKNRPPPSPPLSDGSSDDDDISADTVAALSAALTQTSSLAEESHAAAKPRVPQGRKVPKGRKKSQGEDEDEVKGKSSKGKGKARGMAAAKGKGGRAEAIANRKVSLA